MNLARFSSFDTFCLLAIGCLLLLQPNNSRSHLSFVLPFPLSNSYQRVNPIWVAVVCDPLRSLAKQVCFLLFERVWGPSVLVARIACIFRLLDDWFVCARGRGQHRSVPESYGLSLWQEPQLGCYRTYPQDYTSPATLGPDGSSKTQEELIARWGHGYK